MYAVIFKARLKEPDEAYFKTAARLRELAIARYGCLAFESACEGGFEIAISYWNNLDDISRWKNNEAHRKAQSTGKSKWYSSYEVQVVEVLRGGSDSGNAD